MAKHDRQEGLARDQWIALMVGERDADLRGTAPFLPISWPDASDRVHPAVELEGIDEAGRVVLEHTIIESYPEQIKDQRSLVSIFPCGGVELLELEEAGQFRILVEPGALTSVPFGRRRAVAESIAAWTRANVEMVPKPSEVESRAVTVGHPPGVPFELVLERWTDSIKLWGPLARVVLVEHWEPEDLVALRTSRLRRAATSKIPKLLRSAGHLDRSILILEDRDHALSAPLLVSRALEAACDGIALPDAIYLFFTGAGNPILWRLYEAGVWSHVSDDLGWMTFSSDRSATLNGMAQ